jgi:hypothetical protein
MNNEHSKSFQQTVKKLRFLPPAELQCSVIKLYEIE